MSDKTWKAFERDIAKVLNTRRNPLSGRNNVDDDGKGRLGDVILKDCIVECKLRKKIATIKRARETQKLSKENGLPFIHIEREKGDKSLLTITSDEETIKCLIKVWKETIRKKI